MSVTALLFVFAFVAGCVIALARHPIYGLLTYVGSFYLHPPSRWWGQGVLHDVRWALIAALVTLAAIVIHQRKLVQPARPFFSHGVVIGMVVFIAWIAVQLLWAIDQDGQLDLLSYYIKFAIVMYLIYRVVDTEEHLRMFLWAHVLGCAYLGWLAYTIGTGSRFEAFGGPGIGEANAGALVMVTGILVAGALFLYHRWPGKAAVIGIAPILVNALIATISRSGFLALGTGGLVFNLATPKRFSKRVRVLSVLGIVLFMILTNPIYWARINTIKYRGEHVEGVDTGGGRLEIMQAQVQMFRTHPLGCGHMCTSALSPQYLDPRFLYKGERASHNTFLSMCVDHGVPGAIIYLLMVYWLYRSLRRLARHYRGQEGFPSILYPAVAGSIAANLVGDMFVPYGKFEVRFWFMAIVMVLVAWVARAEAAVTQDAKPAPAGSSGPGAIPALQADHGRT